MNTVITIIINIRKMENRFENANEVFKYFKWQVELNINDNIHLDPEIREADKAYEKMYEYYKYYYDKHNKQ